MKLTEILAISGTAGLHKFVASGRGGGIIVESLGDGKRTMVSGSAKVSALGDIAIFTQSEDVPLADIFTNIYSKHNGELSLGNKSSNEELSTFFGEVLPEYDQERVHISDIKKIVSWYNTLVKAGMTDFSISEDATEEGTETSEPKASAKSAVAKAVAPKPAAAAPKASGSKVKATRSTTVRKSQ